MAIKYCILASGSKGNSMYLEADGTRLLIDIGLSAKQIEQRMMSRELDPTNLDGIVLTHAHRDHTRGIGVFANRHKVPIFAHPDTLDDITHLLKPGADVRPQFEPFAINSIQFEPFEVQHDCEPTMGYLITTQQRKIVMCTDLGYVTNTVKKYVSQANIIVLESNHDSDMLMKGRYPWDLKQRISGRRGHLSNDNAGELLYEIFGQQLEHVILGHLSDENNTKELALETSLKYVGRMHRSKFTVMEQKIVSELFSL